MAAGASLSLQLLLSGTKRAEQVITAIKGVIKSQCQKVGSFLSFTVSVK